MYQMYAYSKKYKASDIWVLYPENNDMKTEVNSMADYYISMYETYYGYTEEQFLKANGLAKTKII